MQAKAADAMSDKVCETAVVWFPSVKKLGEKLIYAAGLELLHTYGIVLSVLLMIIAQPNWNPRHSSVWNCPVDYGAISEGNTEKPLSQIIQRHVTYSFIHNPLTQQQMSAL